MKRLNLALKVKQQAKVEFVNVLAASNFVTPRFKSINITLFN